ncbi:alpha/beta hydrolase [Nocardioides sp. LHG3406-4]|uniref:alpha/beta hydrolase n=1 Tax=Nocardioides sp. LHG3406-4 TaxID=2804575 RepID=UPI003CF687BF
MRRLVALLLVLALVLGAVITGLVVFAGGGDGDSGPPPGRPIRTDTSESSAEVTAPPDAALAQFYGQRLQWSPCQGDFECSALTVPVDYADPGGDTVEISLLKVPAAKPQERVGSLVVNPGGPGAPGTSYAAAADRVFRDRLTDHFDIVGFDPRGTGRSSPVDCLTDDELDAYLATDPVPDTPAENAEVVGWVDRFGSGCAKRSDDIVAHVTTIEAARDMDVLRAALGDEQLDYLGASYGTKLGATYADLFPDRVGHFVLDGAVDVSLGSRQLSLDQAAGFEKALRAYVQNCIDSTDSCFLGDTVDQGLAAIVDLVDRIDAQPLPTDTDRELTVGNAFYGIVAPLYNRDYWFLLSAALRSAEGGDGAGLMELADLYASRGAEGYTDNSAEAIYAINCLDDPFAIEPSEVPAQYAAFEKASPTFGRIFAWGLIGCGGIQVTSSEPARDIRAAGAASIVVVGTTRDPATPYKWAEALAAELESGVLVSRDGDGHTGYNAGNACVDEAVEAYLVDDVVPEDGLRC